MNTQAKQQKYRIRCEKRYNQQQHARTEKRVVVKAMLQTIHIPVEIMRVPPPPPRGQQNDREMSRKYTLHGLKFLPNGLGLRPLPRTHWL